MPATTEDKVATFPPVTETDGAPELAAKVSVLPATVKSAPLKTSPPMVTGPARVAVPAVPAKNAVSREEKLAMAEAFVPSAVGDQNALVVSQLPVPPVPAVDPLSASQ